MTISAFEWRKLPPQIDWSDMQRAKKNADATAAMITRERAKGNDVGRIHGLSPKSDMHARNLRMAVPKEHKK